MSSALPGGQHPVPRAPSPPARRPPGSGEAAGTSVRHSQRGLRSHRVPLAGGGATILALPHGAGGSGQGCRVGVTLSQPGPEEIASQGLRRAAAARSPLAFREKEKSTLVNTRRGDKST